MKRSDVRASTAAVLTAAGIVPAGRVFDSRSTPLANDELPAILVITPRQTDKRRSLNVQAYARTLDVVVEVVTTGDDDAAIESALDVLTDAVMAALLTSDAWLALFEYVDDVQTDLGSGVDAGQRRAAARITFPVRYHVEHVAKSITSAVDLDTVRINADLAPSGTAAIEITLP